MMSRERSNTDDIMEAMELYKNPLGGDEAETSIDAGVTEADERKRSPTAGSGSFDEIVLDWNSLFSQADCDIEVAQLGLKGLLRGCPFRSVCWKLFLGILHEDRSMWCSEMKRHRKEYADIHARFLADPRRHGSGSDTPDVTVNNPLSLDTESPWNKYFQDEELKAMIVRDVERTFPEVAYFQEPNVQAMITDILFCYCRVHTEMGYRQGMHELVAILLLVVDCDKRDSSNIASDDPWADEMLLLLNGDSVEADSYILFAALMETCSFWFSHSVGSPESGSAAEMSPLAKKLERIQDRLLKKEDPLLHAHLQKLSIVPQLYALRWVRLLFAREFPLLDVLVLWDAILAYSPNLDLVDYIALAMLLVAREPLLMSDESMAMKLLLNFPPVGDIHLIVQKALFLRNPKVYERPPNWQLEDVSTGRATTLPASALKNKAGQITQGALLLAGKVGSSAIAKLKNIPAPRGRPGVADRYESSPRSPPKKSAHPGLSQRLRAAAATRDSHTSSGKGMSAAAAGAAGAAAGHGAGEESEMIRTSAPAAARDAAETSLTAPSDLYNKRSLCESPSVALTRLQASCIRCSRHMNLYLRVLQSDVLTLNLPEECEDRVLRSVAGLKQVRDVLCGVLSSDEVQFQSLEGLTLPDGVLSSTDSMPQYDDNFDEAAGSGVGGGG
eukprot:scpid57109/ scgid1213/ TBC1 domain family member 5